MLNNLKQWQYKTTHLRWTNPALNGKENYMKMNMIINIYRYGYCVKHHFQHYFNHIVAVSCIGRGNQRKQPTFGKSLTNFITWYCFEHSSTWTVFELTTLTMIGTDYTGSCKSNYHTIMTTTASCTWECTEFAIFDIIAHRLLSNFISRTINGLPVMYSC